VPPLETSPQGSVPLFQRLCSIPQPPLARASIRVRARARVALASTLALGMGLTLAGTAFGFQPVTDGWGQTASPPTERPSDVNDSTVDTSAQSKPGGGPRVSRGYDISYPQCSGAFPSNPAFAIVGVNGGKVFSANPCLAAEVAWGGGATAELYANTGNPGPALSGFWPKGQTSPRFCDAANPDTADCAYDYGWNAAQQSFQTAQSAYTSLGITTTPAATRWWLDVETANSWRTNTSLNVAALQGELDYLTSAGVANVGFYSTTSQWNTITGGSKVFSPAPSWGAGSPSEKSAKSLCATTVTSFTGGRLAMVQYIYQGFDANVRC
jgi:hypothetical protein